MYCIENGWYVNKTTQKVFANNILDLFFEVVWQQIGLICQFMGFFIVSDLSLFGKMRLFGTSKKFYKLQYLI